MHDPSFMAVPLIVSEKMTLRKTRTLVSEPLKVGQVSKLIIELTLAFQDVCVIHVSWL